MYITLTHGWLLIPDLYGLGIDATIPGCRALIWEEFLKPRYYDQGVSAYWLVRVRCFVYMLALDRPLDCLVYTCRRLIGL